MTVIARDRRHSRRRPRHAVRTVITVGVLVALLLPAGYLFTRLWATNGTQVSTVATGRTAIAYSRPLTGLLTALLEAQAASVAGAPVDETDIRTAINNINGVDRRYGDPMGIRQRWAQLSHEVDTVLSQQPRNADAIARYGTPIGLAQALLERIADVAKVAPYADLGDYQLIETAIQDLPEVAVNAGQLAALTYVIGAAPAPTSGPGRQNNASVPLDPRLSIAKDRVVRAADQVGLGLRAGAGPAPGYSVDLKLLNPLDDFAGAVDELSQTAAGLSVPNGPARAQIPTVNNRVQKAVLALETAVLNAFDTQLTSRANAYAAQRRDLVLAGVVILLAAAVLLWVRVPGADATRTGNPDTDDDGERPLESRGPTIPDLVDARLLLAPELLHVGRGVRARKRQDSDDPQ